MCDQTFRDYCCTKCMQQVRAVTFTSRDSARCCAINQILHVMFCDPLLTLICDLKVGEVFYQQHESAFMSLHVLWWWNLFLWLRSRHQTAILTVNSPKLENSQTCTVTGWQLGVPSVTMGPLTAHGKDVFWSQSFSIHPTWQIWISVTASSFQK